MPERRLSSGYWSHLRVVRDELLRDQSWLTDARGWYLRTLDGEFRLVRIEAEGRPFLPSTETPLPL